MYPKKDLAENSIVDFIDDNEYYQFRKDKQQVENATWAIYIFSVVSFCFYIFYLLLHNANFSWIGFAINISIIIVYFCMGSYSSDKPFNAFIAFFCILGIVFLADLLLTSNINFPGIIIKIILVIYISMRLDVAKKVQLYENKHPEIKK